MLEQIFYGVIGIGIGFIMTLKAHKIVDFTGRISWAERIFGGAGTYTFMRILGIVTMGFFFLYMFGLIGVVYIKIVTLLGSVLGLGR